MPALRVIAYSDFLCPWCYNAHTKLDAVSRELAAEWGEAPQIEWRAYLLIPEPKRRDPDAFREYTRRWLQAAEDEPRASFRVWDSDAPPPTHSVPAHCVAKAAALLGEDAAAAMRGALFSAYFSENRDISDEGTLLALWRGCGFAERAFDAHRDPALAAAVRSDHDEALACGASGVPAVRLADQDFVLTGAQPEALYRRWFERMRERALPPS